MASSLTDHLERIRQKPHHVRRQIAFGTALGITLIVTIGWLGAKAGAGTFALNSPATDAFDTKQAFSETKSNFSELLGAAGAAGGATSSAPSIVVVDGETRSTLDDTRQENYNDTTKTILTF
jgi:hypothetical protein